MADDDVHYFDGKDSRRIADTVRAHEGELRGVPQEADPRGVRSHVRLAVLSSDMDYDESAAPSTWKASFSWYGPEDPYDDDSEYVELGSGAYCWPGHMLQSGERMPSGSAITVEKIAGRWHMIGYRSCPIAIPVEEEEE
jgi:hypothetical protein